MELRIEALPSSHPDARALVEQVQLEYVARYGGRDDTPLEDGCFTPPAGAFFVAYADGRPVASGAWRFREVPTGAEGTCAAEIKRMYVVPAARRAGLARAMLARLEATAHEAGADVMVLETGTRQPEAVGLYTSAGYTPIPGFGLYQDHAGSRYFARRLD